MSDTTQTHHVHQFAKSPKVRDYCHFSVTEKTCTVCGHVEKLNTERDFDLNPLQIAFADYDCSGCREALRGREPDSWKRTTLRFCRDCGCDLTEQEAGRCGICYAADLASFP
jgi:NADH pyrophosphatase NudC (nudix superfamily)